VSDGAALGVVELQPGFHRRIEIEQSSHDLRRLADIGADGKRGRQFGEINSGINSRNPPL
jgi:hypothetical protein